MILTVNVVRSERNSTCRQRLVCCSDILCLRMKNFCFASIGTATTMVLCGCNVHFGSIASYSSSDLKSKTNLVETAAISASVKSLEVVNAFGSVRIIGSDGAAAPGWTQKLEVRAKTEADLQMATNFVCHAELDGDHLKLIVATPNISEPHSFTSDLEIAVPKSVAVKMRNQYGRSDIKDINSNVEAASQFGEMHVGDISGTVRAETSYGSMVIGRTGAAKLRNSFGAIDATEIRGSLEAETSYGPLDARDIDGTVKAHNQFGRVRVEKAGQADLKTSYGDLSAKQIKGDALLINRFGRVDADDITGSVKAETSYGPMDVAGPGTDFICDNQFGSVSVRATSAVSNLEAHTSYARLEVRLPSSVKPFVQARTSYGDIDSDFPMIVKPHGKDIPAAELPSGPRVDLRNQNGNIRVVRE